MKCYLCGSSSDGSKKLSDYSATTKQPMFKFLEKLVQNELNTEAISSSLCKRCFLMFEEYDLFCTKAANVAEKLLNMYQKTTSKFKKIKLSTIKPSNVILLKCNVCKGEFKSISEMRNHSHPKPVVKTEETLVSDIIIEEESIMESVIETDMNDRFSDEDYDPNSDEKATTKQKVPEGYKAVKIQSTFKCAVCEDEFISKPNFNKHMETHDGGSRKSCTICPRTFKTSAALEIHVSNVHEQGNPLECPVCKKVFSQRGALSRHYAIHTGEKSFLCNKCGKQFLHYSSFHMHQLAHENIREKKCEVCGFELRSNSHLKRHMRIHSGEKPYECPVCKQKFAQRYNMRTHLKGHNGIHREPKQQFNCRICSMKFTRKVKLTSHLVEVHDIAEVNSTDQFPGDSLLEEKDVTADAVAGITDDNPIDAFAT